MNGNRTDALDDAQTLCVGERYFGYEHSTGEVHPALALSWLANAQERVGRWVKHLLVTLALGPRTEHAIGVLRKAISRVKQHG